MHYPISIPTPVSYYKQSRGHLDNDLPGNTNTVGNYTIDKTLFFLSQKRSGYYGKQTGIIIVEGTIDHTCFYQLEGNHYARRKTISLLFFIMKKHICSSHKYYALMLFHTCANNSPENLYEDYFFADNGWLHSGIMFCA